MNFPLLLAKTNNKSKMQYWGKLQLQSNCHIVNPK